MQMRVERQAVADYGPLIMSIWYGTDTCCHTTVKRGPEGELSTWGRPRVASSMIHLERRTGAWPRASATQPDDSPPRTAP